VSTYERGARGRRSKQVGKEGGRGLGTYGGNGVEASDEGEVRMPVRAEQLPEAVGVGDSQLYSGSAPF
jgi:hypothetical protein